MLLLRFSASLVLATAICSHGLKKKSLSAGGAVAAFVMGVLHMTCGWTFGLVLICFFATSSKVRRSKQQAGHFVVLMQCTHHAQLRMKMELSA